MCASLRSRATYADDERPLSLRVLLNDNDPLALALVALEPLQQHVALMASAILANFRTYPHATVFYSRDRNHYANSAKRRYFPDYYSYGAVIAAVDMLALAGLIDNLRTIPSPSATKRSRLRATARLRASILDGSSWTPQIVESEMIVLRGAGKKEIDYVDTDQIRAMRADVLAHNAFQGTFVVALNDTADPVGGLLDLPARTYHRVFCGDFEQGGRWYALWQNLKKELRPQITINGESTTELDFRCCHPRLLCASGGLDLPFGDPDFDFYRFPPFEREDVKTAVAVLLNAPSLSSARRALASELERRGRPDPAAGARSLCRAVVATSPGLAPYWGTGVGLRLQRIDSDICTEVQTAMRTRGIPVLSIHDGFIVPAEHDDDLKQVMETSMQIACRHLRANPIRIPRRVTP